MKVVLLPGMDGTGILFEPFIEHAPPDIEITTIQLMQSENYSYEDQAKYVMSQIGDDPVTLVAESYSGMVAYNMLKLGCKNIEHVVFAASFICLPSKLAKFANYFPIALAKSRLVPKALMGQILFGKFTSPSLINYFYSALSMASGTTLSHRLHQIAELKEPEYKISTPCTYIKPSNDIVVSKSAVTAFHKVCSNLIIHEVAGTHFVLQTNPKSCWELIMRAHV
jgi:pimeloyl-ACP methyl ester carboxylesterase